MYDGLGIVFDVLVYVELWRQQEVAARYLAGVDWECSVIDQCRVGVRLV